MGFPVGLPENDLYIWEGRNALSLAHCAEILVLLLAGGFKWIPGDWASFPFSHPQDLSCLSILPQNDMCILKQIGSQEIRIGCKWGRMQIMLCSIWIFLICMLGLFSGDQNQDIRHTEATLVRNNNEMVERFTVLYKASWGDATSNTWF